MKKILALLLVAVLAVALCACAAEQKPAEPAEQKQELRVGLECNYAPFNWTQAEQTEGSVPIPAGGYADGYDVRIAQMIADGLGRELVIVKTEWDGLAPALTSGKIDAIIAGMSPTEERKATIDFSDPYYESDLVIVVRKDGNYANATSLADFSGARIVGQLNTFHDTVIDQIPNVQHETAMETFPAMIVALTSGKVDGYVSERPGAVSAVAANSDLTFISFNDGDGFEASPEDVAVAVGLAKGSDLVGPINDILAGISKEQRQQLMDEAIARQPLSEE